jgi:hypothetical protein
VAFLIGFAMKKALSVFLADRARVSYSFHMGRAIQENLLGRGSDDEQQEP